MEIKSEVITKVKEVLVKEGFSLPSDIQEIKWYDSTKTFSNRYFEYKRRFPNSPLKSKK